jgi:hypothetical protein
MLFIDSVLPAEREEPLPCRLRLLLCLEDLLFADTVLTTEVLLPQALLLRLFETMANRMLAWLAVQLVFSYDSDLDSNPEGDKLSSLGELYRFFQFALPTFRYVLSRRDGEKSATRDFSKPRDKLDCFRADNPLCSFRHNQRRNSATPKSLKMQSPELVSDDVGKNWKTDS